MDLLLEATTQDLMPTTSGSRMQNVTPASTKGTQPFVADFAQRNISSCFARQTPIPKGKTPDKQNPPSPKGSKRKLVFDLSPTPSPEPVEA